MGLGTRVTRVNGFAAKMLGVGSIALVCPAFSVAQVRISSIGQCIHAQTMTTSMLPRHPLASASMPKP